MEKVASLIAAAVTMFALYPPNHPRVRDSIRQVVDALNEALQSTGEEVLSFLIVGDDLLFGNQLVREAPLPVREFSATLKNRGVESLALARGANEEEILSLVTALSTGEGVRSTSHVQIGTVHVIMEEKPKEQEPRKDLIAQLELLRETWARFHVDRNLPIDQLEELVWSLIDSVGSTARAMLPLARLREHDEYTFVNAINVSLLVIAQARSLGIWGPMLHAFGMAGLLHDIGKLDIPQEILNKPGKLSDAEWRLMRQHPAAGASRLVEHGAPPLAVTVAYEHHLRHDGRPNYPLIRGRRVPHLASRMTAIADAYDGMCAVRPYQTTVGRSGALEVIKTRSGTFYDPMLVSNFIRVVNAS